MSRRYRGTIGSGDGLGQISHPRTPSEVVDEAIDRGHAVELQSKCVKNDTDIYVWGSKGTLADLIGMGTLVK